MVRDCVPASSLPESPQQPQCQQPRLRKDGGGISKDRPPSLPGSWRLTLLQSHCRCSKHFLANTSSRSPPLTTHHHLTWCFWRLFPKIINGWGFLSSSVGVRPTSHSHTWHCQAQLPWYIDTYGDVFPFQLLPRGGGTQGSSSGHQPRSPPRLWVLAGQRALFHRFQKKQFSLSGTRY